MLHARLRIRSRVRRSLVAAIATAGLTAVAVAVPATGAAAAEGDTPLPISESFTSGSVYVAAAIERIEPNGYISGWAYSTESDGEPAEFYLGGDVYAAPLETVYRPDIAGGGPYGFEGFLNPFELRGQQNTVSVVLRLPRAVGRPGSIGPQNVPLATASFTRLNRSPIGHFEERVAGEGVGWGWAFDEDSPDTPVTGTASVYCEDPVLRTFNVFLTEAQVDIVATDYREDIATLGATGPTQFSFSFHEPERYRDRGCIIGVRIDDANGNPRSSTHLLASGQPITIPFLPFD